METLKALLAGAFSSAFALIIFAFAFLSLPFNVIAIMHIWGWEWWSALLISVAIGFVPLAGQIAYVVLAVLGAYYFYQAGFSWQEAANPSPKTFQFQDLSAAEFAKFKETRLRPQIVDVCMREAKQRASFDGKIPIAVANFCECYAGVVVANLTQADMTDERATQASEQTKAKIQTAATSQCRR